MSGFSFPPLVVGQVGGTTTNDSAAAGNVGEYKSLTIFNSATTATITMTIAAPCVVTWTAHGFQTGHPVSFTTTGALPTGVSASTTYYISRVDANTFNLATTEANAIAGTFITTTGSQSGTQTGIAGTLMANTTAIDVGALSLTAGDWDVGGFVFFTPAGTTTVTSAVAWVSTTSGTLPSPSNGVAPGWQGIEATLTTGVAQSIACNPIRVSISATTNVFLSGYSAFATSTMNASGQIWARRRR